ncbi:universal stress protein [Actinomadura soli]|uniref:Universal stress protein n=1 Tax=Actinomadura soli TaxID=2508997 RepID=A0A5C4JJT0_9ACTN|nr:universal stress protein [Actinomadura soli]
MGFAVLGGHGAGGADTLPAASTAYEVVGHTPHPVVVVPEGRGRIRGPVVVGVDGSDRSAHALRFAFAEAALRGRQLRTVHVLSGKARPGNPADMRMPEKVRRLTAAVLAGRHAGNPDVDVTEEAHRGDPAEVLATLGDEAELLVVGARARDVFKEQLFGSVSRRVVHSARCPLAVVRR